MSSVNEREEKKRNACFSWEMEMVTDDLSLEAG